MERSTLKRAILQHLLKHQGEWIYGRTLGNLFSCSRRQYEGAIQSLRFQKYPIIADKSKGYKITYDKKEQREYWDKCERELKTRFASIKEERALMESGELWAQPFVIEKQIDDELEAA